MIIPVQCFDCGKVIADKWIAYEKRCRERGEDVNTPASVAASTSSSSSADGDKTKKAMSVRGGVLTELGITKMCCRICMLTHVDLCEVI